MWRSRHVRRQIVFDHAIERLSIFLTPLLPDKRLRKESDGIGALVLLHIERYRRPQLLHRLVTGNFAGSFWRTGVL
jgi:hypothetical protein